MLLLSRVRVWMLAAVSLTALMTGCSTTPNSATQKLSSLVGQQGPAKAMFSGSTPGSADFSANDKLNNPVKVHLAYAYWNEQDQNLLEARGAYDKVLEKSPKNIDAMLGLARLDMQINRPADAEARLLKAQKLAPKNPQVAAALGQYHAARQDWPRAIEQMQAARTLSPYDPSYPFQLGVVQAKSGDVTAALGSFTEAVGPAEAHYNLAVILNEQNRTSDAEYHLQQALAKKPDLPQAQKLLASLRLPRNANSTGLAAAPAAGTQPQSQRRDREVLPAGYLPPATHRQ